MSQRKVSKVSVNEHITPAHHQINSANDQLGSGHEQVHSSDEQVHSSDDQVTTTQLSAPRPLDPKHRINHQQAPGTLWVISVPIGHLEDITVRAMRILQSVALIACEDTRQTRQLFQLLSLSPPTLLACHEHNETQQTNQIIRYLASGQDVALVSDAGTPNISDPGYRVVQACIESGYAVSPIPGACAAITALSVSGLPTDRFMFVGFLPAKNQARLKALQALKSIQVTLIFYESPYRIDKFLASAVQAFGGERKAVIARELTKRYEELRRGTLMQLMEQPGVNRGEIVLLIEGFTQAHQRAEVDIERLIQDALAMDASTSMQAKFISKNSHLSRKEAYTLLQNAKQ